MRVFQLQGDWLLVGDSEGSYGVAREGDQWKERWRFKHPGTSTLLGDTLCVLDYFNMRATAATGAVTPARRSEPVFGYAPLWVRELLLVSAPHYGGPDSIQPKGAVFELPLASCL